MYIFMIKMIYIHDKIIQEKVMSNLRVCLYIWTWSPFLHVICEHIYACINTYMWKHTYDSIFFSDVWLTEDPISDFIWSLLGYILNPDKEKKKP